MSVREILGRWHVLAEKDRTVFIRYVVGGVVTLGFYSLILIVLIEGHNFARGLAVGIGMILAGLLNYLLNKWFVFRSDRRHVQAAPRYVAVLSANVAANMAVTWVASDIIGWPYGLVQVAYCVLAALTVFFVMRHWVMFRRNSATQDER